LRSDLKYKYDNAGREWERVQNEHIKKQIFAFFANCHLLDEIQNRSPRKKIATNKNQMIDEKGFYLDVMEKLRTKI